MKQITLEINNKKESKTIQKCIFKAGGNWSDNAVKVKTSNDKYMFISEDLIITTSSDIYSFNKRLDYLISLSEAVIILDSLIEKQPFLNRSGIKVNFPYKIDSFIKDQYITVCSHNAIDISKRIENLMAADIKARFYNKDVIEEIKTLLLEQEV
jgi:hypothetical protein